MELSPIYTDAPIAVGQADGTFKKYGLNVKNVPYDPTTSVPLVLQG